MAEYLKLLFCATERHKVTSTHRMNLLTHSGVAFFLHGIIKGLELNKISGLRVVWLGEMTKACELLWEPERKMFGES